MAEQNVPTQAPTRTNEQIISVDILRNTNIFRAFSASASVPAIYIQQFWNSMKYDEKTEVYCYQVDEQWFNLSADLLRKALDITSVDQAHPFELPPTGDTVIDFVNQLGYPEPVEFVSNIRVNYVYQPWRAILTLINQCLTGKTSELLWEEFTQGIQTFFSHKASHEASLKDPKKKAVPLLIPYGRFTKMIIYYLGSTSDVHKRPESLCHLPGDDFLLAIQQSLYYPKYLEMVAKNTKKTPQDSASKQPEPATKRAPPKKPTTTTPVKQTKTPSPKQPKSLTKKPSKRKLPQKARKGKPSFQLVDEDDEAQQESVPQEEGDDPDLELAKKMSLDAHPEKGEVTIRDPVSDTTTKLPEVVGKGKAIVTEEQVAHSLIDLSKKKRTTDQFILFRSDQAPHDSTTGPSSQPEDDTSEKVIHESSSTSDSERTESETEAAAPKGDKEQGEVDSSTVTSGVSIPVSTQGQAGSDPEKAHEALAGPNPEHMDDEFLATAYPKVHENLKLITDKCAIEYNPKSHSSSMSSMKNLEDTDNFGDQFLYDKPTKDDQEKSKVVDESDSTLFTITSTPLVIALVTDFSSPKPSSLVTPPPINTEATTITTSLPEITPFIALQLRVARLEQEMSEVKKTDHSADVLASIKSQVPTVVDKYLGTKLDDALLRILERHTADLIEKYSVLPGPESIKNQESEKSPKEIIRIKREQGEEKQESTYSIRSTDKVALEEFDLKSALFKHMNKNKTANRNPANYHLYHALMEALIADEDAMDKEVKDRVKDHKRKHDSDDDEDDDDDEGPSAGSNQGKSAKRRRHDSGASGSAQPPTKDDEQSSKKPQDSDASASKQHPTLTSTGWQITDTRDAVIDSSMHSSEPESGHSEHNSEHSSGDVSKQDEGHVSDLEDTDNAHIPKRTTGQMHTPHRIKLYSRVNKASKEDMDECHKLLTNKVDLVNPEGHQILRNIYEPLPLGGPPGQVTIQPQFFFNKDLEYLLTGFFRLLWVESERDYDISAAYGITHWWLRRKQFYINKHSEPSDREAVRSQMRILSVIRVKTFEKYGYNYLREIILRRADYKEYKISKKDFKNLHPNDFEDLYLLNIQDKLNHLSKSDKIHLHTAVNMWIRNLVIRNRVGDLQLGIESYQTKLNLERPNWDATDYSFKEDYTIVPKPRAVIYRDRNDQRKLMRLNEIHKFSDGTLTRVMEKLDHMIKDFHRDQEKTTDQEDLSKSGKLCWRKNKRY
ncbi:hypothetical protein Tco_0706155 [Tanacetum coccineum]|uniref:Monodehydroascorbate reductase n=1 Tax=Tanacetum coccineum TaxID=301880 RepID=A0ABQ4Y6L0_9ASTR